jgi:acetyl esterase/lipase
MGFSAGGHLAAHYTNCYDCEEVRAIFPESKPVNASVLCYPVITADPQWRHTGSCQNLSGSNELTQEIIDKFSLQTKVSCSTPPTFLWHTQEDKTVPVINSILYAKALAENNVPFALHIYPFGPHGLATVDRLTRDNTPENVKQVHNWMADASRWLFDVL